MDSTIPSQKSINMRYEGAISDTDILINLAKANGLGILRFIFKKVIVPQYIHGDELRRKAGIHYQNINTMSRLVILQ